MSSIKRLCMLETNEFLSYQPYLELNNNYQSYVPIEHNIIRDIVWEVYEVDDFDLGKTVALPDVCADIMTFYTDDNAYSFFMGGSISLQQMNELDFMKDVKSIFGVRLRTGMLGNLFRCDVKDINNSRIAMSDALWNGREYEKRMAEAMEKIYEKAAQLGGKVSGEHGIGFAKKPYLRESLDLETIELMSGIKKAFDPKNILNPHKVFQS